jgi:hypothetical protein
MILNDSLSAENVKRTPNVARMYDYLLGGKDNFEADRQAMDEILKLSPSAKTAAADNRAFLRRAVFYAASSGITRFIDIGSGLPTVKNTHEVVRNSAVVYVDNDPVVVAHARALLSVEGFSIAIQGDLRDPRRIMEDPDLRSFLGRDQPVCIVLAAILHFLGDSDANTAVTYLKGVIPDGSMLVISHATADDATKEQAETVRSVYSQRVTTPIRLRTRAEIQHFFDGFELVEPGITDIRTWHPGKPQPQPETQMIGYGGVGVKRAAPALTSVI